MLFKLLLKSFSEPTTVLLAIIISISINIKVAAGQKVIFFKNQ